tara:strand:+ start:506 stop:1486 length:981 start_codon:yes stop_codon:yes gene_type:complete
MAVIRSNKRGGLMRYPLEALTESTDYLQFDIVEYQSVGSRGSGNLAGRPGSRRIKGPQGTKDKQKSTLGTIQLQMPSQIQDGNSVDYGESTMNTLIGAAAGGIMKSIDKLGSATADSLKGDTNKAEESIKGLGTDLKSIFSPEGDFKGLANAGSTFVTAKATSAALGLLGGNVSTNQLLARQSGQIFNPNMELLFNGPSLRSFRFSFKMTPRSAQEAQAAKDIIRSFKLNMAPKTKGGGDIGGVGIFLKTPNVFELRYRKGNQDHPFLHKFKQCFLTECSVNYTGEGVYATYDDATPISMQLDLSFKELEPIYDVDYDQTDGTVGF